LPDGRGIVMKCGPMLDVVADFTLLDELVLPEQREAVEALLERSGREFVPVRRSFVQDRAPGGGPSPPAAFVTGRRRRALDCVSAAARAGAPDPDHRTLGC
jgi:hypothetical protein